MVHDDDVNRCRLQIVGIAPDCRRACLLCRPQCEMNARASVRRALSPESTAM